MERTEHISAAEFRKKVGLDPVLSRANKMNSHRSVSNDGISYASKKEEKYAEILRKLRDSGLILGFAEQISIPLAQGSKNRYRLDFLIIHKQLENGNFEVSFVDPTGFKTDKKKLNVSMMKTQYGIEIMTP